MNLNDILGVILPIGVLIWFALVIYSGIKKQKIGETWHQIMDSIKGR